MDPISRFLPDSQHTLPQLLTQETPQVRSPRPGRALGINGPAPLLREVFLFLIMASIAAQHLPDKQRGLHQTAAALLREPGFSRRKRPDRDYFNLKVFHGATRAVLLYPSLWNGAAVISLKVFCKIPKGRHKPHLLPTFTRGHNLHEMFMLALETTVVFAQKEI